MPATTRSRILASVLVAVSGAPVAAQNFTNGNFSNGLAGWSVVNTVNGVGAPGTTATIDIDGPGLFGPSPAARFQVGQNVFQLGVQRGIEMTQAISLTAGRIYQIELYWSAQKFSGANASDGGVFSILADGSVLAQGVAGSTGPTLPRYGSLTGIYRPTSSGPVNLGVRITRAFTPAADLFQYVDNARIAELVPPSAFDLGELGAGDVVSASLNPTDVRWVTFVIPAIAAPAYLDIDLEGTSIGPSNNTALGLYSDVGNLIASDDDDGSGQLSQLTFGNTSPRPPVGDGLPYDGRDGSLPAGRYYVAVTGSPSTLGATGWNANSFSTDSGFFRLRLAAASDVATGACCLPDGSCTSSTQHACTLASGLYRGDATTCATVVCTPFGACCTTTGTCAFTTAAACATSEGVFQGEGVQCAGVSCPQPAACCLPDGTCAQRVQSQCTSAGGVFHPGIACAGFACPGGFTARTDIPGSFTDIATTGASIQLTFGSADDGTGPFTSSITNGLVTNPNLVATTNGVICNAPTFTEFFNRVLPVTFSGLTFALFANWDDLVMDGPATIRHRAAVEGGVNVHIIQWDQARSIFTAPPVRGSFQVKIFGPGGPALVQFIYPAMAWDYNGNSSTVGVQWGAASAVMHSFGTINAPPPPPGPIPDFSVVSIVGPVATCYANCDASTTAPILNVQDFACFLNAFAGGAAYANCDGSTTVPVLNVQDFSCFLNAFAAGCT